MSTSHAPHISIGQPGHHGNAAQCPVVVVSNPGAGSAKMETNVLDAARYVTQLMLMINTILGVDILNMRKSVQGCYDNMI